MSEQFITSHIHPSWTKIVAKALACMDQNYLQHLSDNPDWLPGASNILNAFSLPLDKTRYILFGESPYPRAQSANGYAFWDAAVTEIWSTQGFSKPVNRATSLRNFIKMLLVADNALSLNDTSQPAISKIDKSIYISKLDDLFNHIQESG
ncbi:MAG: uracil-DNA glycosylase, partial [Gammaproteobacteria bacterium]|nr:uracil-DNA glycosylase [Gammaproteobacteria bacterium]